MIESGFFTSLIGFFIVLTPLIFFHELGHYFAAKKSGVALSLSQLVLGLKYLVILTKIILGGSFL